MEVDHDEFGIDPGDSLDSLASGRRAQVASQQKLGLWTKRRTRPGSDNHSHSYPAGARLDRRGPQVAWFAKWQPEG